MKSAACEPKRSARPKAGDLSALVDSTLEVIAHTLRSGRCSFMLLDRPNGELRVAGARGLSAEVISRSRARLGESIAGMVASSCQAMHIEDVNADPELRGRSVGTCKSKSLLSVPVVVRGEVYGVLNATDRQDDLPFGDHDLATLNLLASHLALCIENSLLQAQIQRLANTDGLTGAYNHRYFHERLHEEMERAGRYGKSVSLLMIDVNKFKEYNDSYGHPAGDSILQEIASVISRCVRHLDLVCRYGGDEFTVILPETNEHRAAHVAARIARSVTVQMLARSRTTDSSCISVSVGISSFPSPAGYKQQLIEQADKAMYIAKQAGSTHVAFWQDPKLVADRLATPERPHELAAV